MDSDKTLRVAAAQLPAHTLEQADQALASIERAVARAADAGVDLLVLPECAYPAYLIGSVESYRSAAVLRGDEYVIQLSRWARKKKLHIVSGYVEDVGTHLHNSAVLIDAEGQEVGRYRKSFLWDNDNEWFKPGDRMPVFETAVGRIGMVICADTRAPEIVASLAARGAELLAMPTCWINTAADGGFENPQPEFLISARAREFAMPFVCANKFGQESPTTGYCGRSLIAAKTGVIQQEAPGDQEVLITEQIELRDHEQDHADPELWESLLSWDEPIRPSPREGTTIRIALRAGEALTAETFKEVCDRGADLLVANGVADAEHLQRSTIDLALPRHIGAIRRLPSATLACLRGSDFTRFSAARLLALGGVELICVFDAPDDLALLRTRAVENRIFVAAINSQSATLVSPEGRVMASAATQQQPDVVTEADLSEAASKIVAPKTDIWEQRRVSIYR